MKKAITVVEARYVSGHRLHLMFSDGSEGVVDFSRWLHRKVFEPLRDTAYFKRYFLSGGTVCWPNGADIAPETLRSLRDQSESAA